MSHHLPHEAQDGPGPVRGPAVIVRLAAIGAVVLTAAAGFAYTGGWLTPGRLSPERVVDALEANNGQHPGFRRNHAKGICIAGTFTGNGAGPTLSKASVFAGAEVPVIGRLALAAGRPAVPDETSPVWSMALRFLPADGDEWRTGMNNIPVFPVRNVEEFAGFLAATRPDPATGKPDPAAVQAFLTAHPATAAALQTIKAAPPAASFATATYSGLNTFRFVNAEGEEAAVRWSMVPEQTETERPAPSGPNYLFDELIEAVGQGQLRWHLVVTLAGPGDVTADPTVAWPPDRQRVEVGTLTVASVEGEDTGSCRDVTFDPLVLPAGIEPADDPFPAARSAAYAEGLRRRDGEAKRPSAVQVSAVRAGESG
ncbi:catalase family peroxidase [Geminicoccus flavidas]|uniref:catalase family peroxidase n=1 Tax=Geminicoccus flavidas TaxID=2506407 RepID=UPI001F2F329C|nr:catalase family peroxidase [Geminicoccus flavidas]